MIYQNENSYTLKKFKRIYKREMQENPLIYLKKGEQQPIFAEKVEVIEEIEQPQVMTQEEMDELAAREYISLSEEEFLEEEEYVRKTVDPEDLSDYEDVEIPNNGEFMDLE